MEKTLVTLSLVRFFLMMLSLMFKNCLCCNIHLYFNEVNGIEELPRNRILSSIHEKRVYSDVASLISWSTFLVFWSTIKDHWENQTQVVNTEQSRENKNFLALLQVSQPYTPAKWLLSAPELSWNSYCHSLLLLKCQHQTSSILKIFHSQLRAWRLR